MNSPIKWVGGKSKLVNKLIPLIPSHKCYVEVFGGAGGMLFAKEPSTVEMVVHNQRWWIHKGTF